MTGAGPGKDLVVLAADQSMGLVVEGLLGRTKPFRIREVKSTIYVHRSRDPGCLKEADAFLRPFHRQYRHALVLFDRKGCGREGSRRENIEREIEGRLSRSGWDDRAAAIVIDPELEVWIWSGSPLVERVFGWTGKSPDLRSWLSERGHWSAGQMKPDHPKRAVVEALERTRIARSSSLYVELAKKVGLDRCADPAFGKLKATLKGWFPEAGR